MPRGIVTWFDPKTGEGFIRRFGRDYPVRVGDLDKEARVPRARVVFDIERRGGVRHAVKVHLRRGTRVSHRQHRFGDLAGARHPDQKGHPALSHRQPRRDWDLLGHPTELARTWVELLERGDIPTALLLYDPGVRLHLPEGSVDGRAAVQRLLESWGEMQVWNPQVQGEEGSIVIRWNLSPNRKRRETRIRIVHGRIVEQWIEG